MVRRFGLSWVFMAVVLVFDLITKALVHHLLPLMGSAHLWYPYGGVGIFQNLFGIEFSIGHVVNHGAAGGFLNRYQTVLLSVRCLLLVALGFYALWINRHRNRDIPLWLIIGGALGNILDSFFYGHVVDMFHFVLWGYDMPLFNVADAAISIGVFWLMLEFWTEGRAKRLYS